MPGHTRREPDALLLMLERDGEEPQTRRAVGGEQALLFAMTMLIDCRRLRVGDRLTVEASE
jgi:hypothetical protein